MKIDARLSPDESIDVRLLAREDLSELVFPGGRNDGFRVFFAPEVHAALWAHALEDTTVEICGVLVGSWHRDALGPFVTIVGSIRGEGALTRTAEVTFTQQTWSKINAEMDDRFAALAIVGWYHTHPDFGIFLSDRDRFIQEHFFCGPGQVAHVIDPLRKIEGVFVWRNGTPTETPHFWVGDRVVTESSRALDAQQNSTATRAIVDPPSPRAATRRGIAPMQLAIYASLILFGYALASLLSSWRERRFVESVVARNTFAAVLRMGLAEELDQLDADLAAVAQPLSLLPSKTKEENDAAVKEARTHVENARLRLSSIKGRFANTPAEDELLRSLAREQLARVIERDAKKQATTDNGPAAKPTADPGKDAK